VNTSLIDYLECMVTSLSLNKAGDVYFRKRKHHNSDTYSSFEILSGIIYRRIVCVCFSIAYHVIVRYNSASVHLKHTSNSEEEGILKAVQ